MKSNECQQHSLVRPGTPGFKDNLYPNGDTFSEHGNSERSPETTDLLSLSPLIIGVGQNIVNMDRPALRNDPPGNRFSPGRRDRI